MKTNLTYHREKSHLLSDLISPESPLTGIWGIRRKQHLQKYRDGIYTGLLLIGNRNDHFEEIDPRQARCSN